MTAPLSGNAAFIAQRQQFINDTKDTALKKHFQAEIDLVKSWGKPEPGDIQDHRPTAVLNSSTSMDPDKDNHKTKHKSKDTDTDADIDMDLDPDIDTDISTDTDTETTPNTKTETKSDTKTETKTSPKITTTTNTTTNTTTTTNVPKSTSAAPQGLDTDIAKEKLKTLDPDITAAAAKYGIPKQHLQALIVAETQGISVNNLRAAYGAAQMDPGGVYDALKNGVDPWNGGMKCKKYDALNGLDPLSNKGQIEGAAAYLDFIKTKTGADWNSEQGVGKILTGYNGGSNTLNDPAYLRKHAEAVTLIQQLGL